MEALQQHCLTIDGRSYKAYKRLTGTHDLGGGRQLLVDHVQGDPFAPPSRMRIRLPWSRVRLPAGALEGEARRRACRDWLSRRFRAASRDDNILNIDAGGQTVLERSSVLFDEEAVEFRLLIDLPGRGRSILGRQAAEALTERLPKILDGLIQPDSAQAEQLLTFCQVVEDQVAMRAQLEARGLVAFVGDGSILPRASGVSEGPLAKALPFQSPESLRITLERPNAGPVSGMAVPMGVTLIVGGGYHGKSTLLSALQNSVYDHVPGDGRETVVTRGDAMKIRAEDGRSVSGMDLSPFIADLPGGISTRRFQSVDASGSTSQAAALLEAMEGGSRCLLMDEDTSATNFLIRDERMRQLVATSEEPITPFVDRVRQLAEEGVSTLLVLGGSGDYLAVADTVIQMKAFQPLDVTARARAIGGEPARAEDIDHLLPQPRPLKRSALRNAILGAKGRMRIRVRETGLTVGACAINLSALEQLQDAALQRGVAWLLMALIADGDEAPLKDLPALLAEWLERPDWHGLSGATPVDAARPRVVDILAALSRLRAEKPIF